MAVHLGAVVQQIVGLVYTGPFRSYGQLLILKAGGTACVPVALAEAESGTMGMSASPFARLLKQASRRQELLDSLEFHSRIYGRLWHLMSQNDGKYILGLWCS